MARPISELNATILKMLDSGTLAMNDLFDFLFLSGRIDYNYRLNKENYKAFKHRSWQRRVAMNAEHQKTEEKQHFYNLMYRLHNQGLVTKEKQGIKTMLTITKKGIEKMRAFKKIILQKNNKEKPRIAPRDYQKIKSPSSIIISFDIPEKEKYKRAWLRSVLRNLNYKILHESVWIGNTIPPKELLDDCRRMNMIQYIHIFAVFKKGTIAE